MFFLISTGELSPGKQLIAACTRKYILSPLGAWPNPDFLLSLTDQTESYTMIAKWTGKKEGETSTTVGLGDPCLVKYSQLAITSLYVS